MIYKEEKLDSQSPTPVGANVFYKCTICNEQIASLPRSGGSCKCSNIRIDSDAGRIAIRDYDNAFVVRAN